MKLLKKGIITFLCLSLIFLNTKVVKADTLLPNAKSGLLMEVSTGTIIYEKNIHEKVSVASMTKMMGMILVMEALEDGNIRLDEKIKTSKNASNMGGSQIWLEEGEEITVLDLIKGIMMASANDGIVAMAERIGGTEADFGACRRILYIERRRRGFGTVSAENQSRTVDPGGRSHVAHEQDRHAHDGRADVHYRRYGRLSHGRLLLHGEWRVGTHFHSRVRSRVRRDRLSGRL